ncbi:MULTISPECIES: hypothetical protein [unclassified Pedobacter]|uniref:hypothetical protein n=1 Tax=unclassified Pedobacter TaxID=2628915 RepID=UPI001E2CC578|nr:MULTISPECIES: hypothetical protein [unclassified Pedobacter]
MSVYGCPDGKEITYGRFALAMIKIWLEISFHNLLGNFDMVQRPAYKFEFIEEVKGLPIPCVLNHCSMEELKENVAIISRKLSRIAHLENKDIEPLK